MRSFEIDNIKQFTAELFTGTTFDSFCVTQADFDTLFGVAIDGHINRAFLGQNGENAPDTVTWEQIRTLCCSIVKGKRLPVRFRIVFMTPPERVAGFVQKHGVPMDPGKISGLFINVKYENEALTCVTGVSVKEFSLDKSLDVAWDESVAKFLKRFG